MKLRNAIAGTNTKQTNVGGILNPTFDKPQRKRSCLIIEISLSAIHTKASGDIFADALDQAAARVWEKRTGMCLIPAIRFDLSRSTLPASSICSIRLSRSASIRCNSRRAR